MGMRHVSSFFWVLDVCCVFCFSVQALTDSNCIPTLTCHFEENDCGFPESVNWRREHDSSGYYQRFEYKDGSAEDLVSPPLCNSNLTVHVSCAIITSNVTGLPAELHVLTQCNGDSAHSSSSSTRIVTAGKDLSSSWKNISVTLPTCPPGQSLQVVFRAMYALPGSIIKLGNIRIEPDSKQAAAECIRRLSCQFENNTCGFLDSPNWHLENTSFGDYQLYTYTDGTSTDLLSPPLCNSALSVRFAYVVITNSVPGPPAELHVLTVCDDRKESAPFVVYASQGQSLPWINTSLTFPACPAGQSPRVVFRAVYALPGTVIMLDNILLEAKDVFTTVFIPTTTVIMPFTTLTTSTHARSTRQQTTRHVIRTSWRQSSSTKPHTEHSLAPLTSSSFKTTSRFPDIWASTPGHFSVEVSTQTKITRYNSKPITLHNKTIITSLFNLVTSSLSSKETTFEQQRTTASSLYHVTTSSHHGVTPSSPVRTFTPNSVNPSSQPTSALTSWLVPTSPQPAVTLTSTVWSKTALSSFLINKSTTTHIFYVYTPKQDPKNPPTTQNSRTESSITTSTNISMDYPKQDAENHTTTQNSDSESSVTVTSQMGHRNDDKRVIIGVVVGVCGTALVLAAVTVLIFRRYQQIRATKEDRQDLIKLERHWNHVEPVF